MWRLNPEEKDQILKELGIIPLPKPIMEMNLKEIRQYFGYPSSNGIKKAILLRNLIWQLYGQILSGNPPDFYKKHGFIRGMWYYIKKKLTQHHPLRGNMYDLMTQQLTLMVKKGLFGYADFNFRDRDAGTWRLGFDNPHIILMAEKDGYVTIMEELYQLYGCHIITAGGVPSFMTVNYMVSAMKRYEVDMTQTFYVITFCDFDPAGYNIAEELMNHFKDSGLSNFHLFNQWGKGKKQRPWLELAVPLNFDKPIKEYRYKLPKSIWNNPSTAEWVELTGGLDGPSWRQGSITHGLESDEFDLNLIEKLFEKALLPLLHTPSDQIKKRIAMQALRQELENMAIIKFLEKLQGKPPRISA